jgi:hypothetical protein
VSLNVTRSWAAATCAAVAAGEQPGMPWVLSAADHALCTAAPSSPADSLPPDTREWILARYGVLLLLCRPMALDRGCCPEVSTCRPSRNPVWSSEVKSISGIDNEPSARRLSTPRAKRA